MLRARQVSSGLLRSRRSTAAFEIRQEICPQWGGRSPDIMTRRTGGGKSSSLQRLLTIAVVIHFEELP